MLVAVKKEGKVVSIALMDAATPVLNLSVAQALNDGGVLKTVTTPYGVSVSDTATNIFGDLKGLQSLFAGGNLKSVVVTDAVAQTKTISPEAIQINSGVLSILAGNFTVMASSTGGDESILGGSANDIITWASGHTYLRGGAGDDSVQGGSGFDDINGNMGNDTAHGNDGDDWVVGGKDNDLLYGDAGFDIVYGNMGNDTVLGGDGNDWVRGGQGDDSVSGGAGDDWLWGDKGNDTISGGSGADKFHSLVGAGIDRVIDFNRAEGDQVILDGSPKYTLSQVGADTVIDMGNGDQMILVGVTYSTLSAGWIVGG